MYCTGQLKGFPLLALTSVSFLEYLPVSALKFNIVQQAISYQFGDAIIDADSDPNVGWDNRSLSLSSYSSGFDRNFNSHFRYENFIVPNRKKLYIAIENQLSGQLGWLHLQIIDHSEIQLYGYALQKLL